MEGVAAGIRNQIGQFTRDHEERVNRLEKRRRGKSIYF